MFDDNCKQMLDLMQDVSSFEKTKYYKAFKTFDGNTGFDLFCKLNGIEQQNIVAICNHLLQICKEV
jgi:hypothetical protein